MQVAKYSEVLGNGLLNIAKCEYFAIHATQTDWKVGLKIKIDHLEYLYSLDSNYWIFAQ